MSRLIFHDGISILDETEWQLVVQHIPYFHDTLATEIIIPDTISKHTFKKLMVLLEYGKHNLILSDKRLFQLSAVWGTIPLLHQWKWDIDEYACITDMDQYERTTEVLLRTGSSIQDITISLLEMMDFVKPRYPMICNTKIATHFRRSIPQVPFVAQFLNEVWVAGEALVDHIKKLPMTCYDFYFTCTEERAKVIIDDMYNSIRSIVDYVIHTTHMIQFVTRDDGIYRVHTELYNNVQHILVHQTIDCCCVATNGLELVTLSRGYQSLQYSIIVVDPYLMDDTYIDRLVWFSHKGFIIQCPGWKHDWKYKVSQCTDIYKSYTTFTGLRKLAWCLIHKIHPQVYPDLCKSTDITSLSFYLYRFFPHFFQDRLCEEDDVSFFKTHHVSIPYLLSNDLTFTPDSYQFRHQWYPPTSMEPLTFCVPSQPLGCPTFYRWCVLN